MGDTHFLTTVLTFEDGSREGQIMHTGTKEDCDKVSAMIPAVAYSGERKAVSAHIAIVPYAECSGAPLLSGERWRYEPSPDAATTQIEKP